MHKKTDKELIENIKKRDEKTILFLRTEYEPMVKYMVLNYKFSDGKNTVSAFLSDTEDILHDALYVLIKKVSETDFQLSSKLSTYFYAVAKNLLKLKLRKRTIEKRGNAYLSEHPVNQERTDTLYDKNLKENAFDFYFMKLSEVCRKILKLYWQGYNITEIAEKTGNTKKYIMKRKYECTNRLIKLIKKNTDQLDF